MRTGSDFIDARPKFFIKPLACINDYKQFNVEPLILMYKKIIPALLVLAASVFSGCASDTGKTSLGNTETNILGIYKSEEADYTKSKPTAFSLSSDELSARSNYSGDKVTLLWGLVSLEDF